MNKLLNLTLSQFLYLQNGEKTVPNNKRKCFASNAAGTTGYSLVKKNNFDPSHFIRSGGRNGNSLQYSCLDNPMDREAQQAIVRGVTKSRTRLRMQTHTYFIWHTKISLRWMTDLNIEIKARKLLEENMR